jgi:hypothetical protein
VWEPKCWRYDLLEVLIVLQVVDFYNLRRLSLPMNALVRSGDQRVDPLKALPESLEHLEIRACNRLLYEW